MYRLLFYVYVCVKAAVRQFKCIMKYLVDKQKRVAKKRVMGIEPTYPAWKAGVLPLNYTRIFNCSQVGVTGFEPATSWSQTRRSSQAEPHPEGFVCVLSVTQELVYSKGQNMSTTFFIFFIFFLKWLPDSLKELPGRHFIRIRCN